MSSRTVKSVVAILVGARADRGFVQSGYEGLRRAEAELGLSVRFIDHTEFDAALLERRVRDAGASQPDAVIVHGSKSEAAVEAVAPSVPNVPFLVTGGHLTLANVWGYPVKHYQAAFLAGLLAAKMTRTGVVGHLSGVPIRAGKFGRAAFAQGVHTADAGVRLVTGFCGNQDDAELAKQWTQGEIDRGVDVLFTMLNFGRTGAIEACRSNGIKQIGNIRDWTVEEPDVFIGSAIANHGRAVFRWLQDLAQGKLRPMRTSNWGSKIQNPSGWSLPIAYRKRERCGPKVC